MRLKLSDTERLILANQYEILATLKKDESLERLAQNLRDGHEWLYSQGFGWFSENLPAEAAEHVIRILGIYGDMKASFDALTDKTGIDEKLLNFPGFDDNNESELLLFTRALRKSDRFIETIGHDAKNSHMPTTATYRRMIAKWRDLGEPNYPYSRDQIAAILDARIHPDSRT